MKEKFKNYSFWLSVTGAVILLLNNVGKIFGFTVNNEAIYSIVDGVCGVLVVFGVLTMNTNKNKTETEDTVSNDKTEETKNTGASKEIVKEKVKDNIKNTEKSDN